jgi:hypothetical protein
MGKCSCRSAETGNQMTDLNKTMIYAILHTGIGLIFLSDFVGYYYHDLALTIAFLAGGFVAVSGGIIAIAVRRAQNARRKKD